MLSSQMGKVKVQPCFTAHASQLHASLIPHNPVCFFSCKLSSPEKPPHLELGSLM